MKYKCPFCHKVSNVSASEKRDYQVLGYYTPEWYVSNENIDEKSFEKNNINPKSDKLVCYDCLSKVYDYDIELKKNKWNNSVSKVDEDIVNSYNRFPTKTQMEKGIKTVDNVFMYCVNCWNLLCVYICIEHMIVENEGEFIPKNIKEIVDEAKSWYDTYEEPGHARNPSSWSGNERNSLMKEKRHIKAFIDVFSNIEDNNKKNNNKKNKKIKIVKDKKIVEQELKNKEEEEYYKNTITYINYNNETQEWYFELGDGEGGTWRGKNFFAYVQEHKEYHLAEYYHNFVENFITATSLENIEIKNNPKKYTKKLLSSLNDKEVEDAYDLFTAAQVVGKISKKRDFSVEGSGVDACFYDDEGRLVGFKFENSREVDEDEEIELTIQEQLERLGDEKYYNEEDIKYWLLEDRKSHKFYKIEKEKVDAVLTIKPNAIKVQPLTDNWIEDINKRKQILNTLMAKNVRELNGIIYDYSSYKLFDINGDVIKQNLSLNIEWKGVTVSKHGNQPIFIPTGRMSHHRIDEISNYKNKEYRPSSKIQKRIDDMMGLSNTMERDPETKEIVNRKEFLKRLEKDIRKRTNENRSELERAIREKWRTTTNLINTNLRTNNTTPVQKTFNSNIDIDSIINKALKNLENFNRDSTHINDTGGGDIESLTKIILNAKYPIPKTDINLPLIQSTSLVGGSYENILYVMDDNDFQKLVIEANNLAREEGDSVKSEIDYLMQYLNSEDIEQNGPVFLYSLTTPPPRIAKKYIYNRQFGCLYAAIKFFMYVSNTPLDEEYTYERVIPEHKRIKNTRVSFKTRSGRLKTPEEIDEEMEQKTKDIITVPEHTVTVKHVPDNDYVRGDWCMTFRGITVKAFHTDGDDNSNADYWFTKEDFELDNEFLDLDAALEREDKILKIAETLEDLTKDCFTPPDLDGEELFDSSTFDCPCTNSNPRWQMLEFGYYKNDTTGGAHQGPKYLHGVKNGYTYQAPKGFIGITDMYLRKLMETTKGGSGTATTLVNRFILKWRLDGKRIEEEYTRYYGRWIKDKYFDARHPNVDFDPRSLISNVSEVKK